MAVKQFDFRSRNQWNKLDTPEKRVYQKFITEISGLMVDGYDWALLRVWKDVEDVLQIDVYFEWSWFPYTYECTSELFNDIKEVDYEDIVDNGEGYYLVTVLTEYELIDSECEAGRFVQDYFKSVDNFVKFISLDEVESIGV